MDTSLHMHRLRPTDARAGLLLLATLLCWHPHVNATTRHIHTERCRTLGSSSRLFRTAHATVVPRPGFGVFTGEGGHIAVGYERDDVAVLTAVD